MDHLIRDALNEVFQEIVNNTHDTEGDGDIRNDEQQQQEEVEREEVEQEGYEDQPVIAIPEPNDPQQGNQEFINIINNIPLNPMNIPMNQMNMNPMNRIPINPMNMNPIGIQVILGGLGIRGRGMNILERSFQEQVVKDSPICNEFQTSLKEITITQENNTDYTCAICQDTPEVGDTMIELPCEGVPHYFHKGDDPETCGGILSWFQKNHLCPVCRTEFPKKEEEEADEGGEGLEDGGEGLEEGEEGVEEGGEGEIVLNIPFQDVIQAGGIQSMMNHIMRDIYGQREEDEIQEAILRSFEES